MNRITRAISQIAFVLVVLSSNPAMANDFLVSTQLEYEKAVAAAGTKVRLARIL